MINKSKLLSEYQTTRLQAYFTAITCKIVNGKIVNKINERTCASFNELCKD